MNAQGSNFPPGCLSEEQIEVYLLGNAPPVECEITRGHLLFCAGCQDRAEEVEEFAATLRVAAKRLAAEESTYPRSIGLRLGLLISGLAVATIALLVVPTQRSVRPDHPIVLVAHRGEPSELAISAPARAPLVLIADAAELPSTAVFRLTIVDVQGREEQSVALQPERGQLRWRLGTGLAPGNYWVRIANAPSGELLQEIALRIE